MSDPIEVTGDDVLATWNDLFGPLDPALAHIEVLPPDESAPHVKHLLARIRRAMENDRRRVAARVSHA